MNFIVIGGAGALGKAIVSKISSKTTATNTIIVNIDHKPNAQTTFDINMNLIPTAEIQEHVFKKLAQMKIEMVDVVINVAGGWTDGDTKSDCIVSI
jgi:saccharopine dehydrogenase-like NADP-dependent oxidoreductase